MVKRCESGRAVDASQVGAIVADSFRARAAVARAVELRRGAACDACCRARQRRDGRAAGCTPWTHLSQVGRQNDERRVFSERSPASNSGILPDSATFGSRPQGHSSHHARRTATQDDWARMSTCIIARQSCSRHWPQRQSRGRNSHRCHAWHL